MSVPASGDRRSRVYWMDLLRITAAFAVLVTHVCAQCLSKTEVGAPLWNHAIAWERVNRWGVPIFAMLSGALMLGERPSMERVWRQKLPRLLIAYVVWTLIYTLEYWVYGEDWETLLVTLLSGPAHLWYLPMTVGMYLLLPILRSIAADEGQSRLYLILSFAYGVVLPQVQFAAEWMGETAYRIVSIWTENLHLQFVVGFSFYYLLGHWIVQKWERIAGIRWLVPVCLMGFPLTVLCSSLYSRYLGVTDVYFSGSFTINILMESVALFLLFRRWFGGLSLSPAAGRLVEGLSRDTFGIYLIHPAVIGVLSYLLHLNTFRFPPAVSIPVMSVIVFVLSAAASGVMNRIPGLKHLV